MNTQLNILVDLQKTDEKIVKLKAKIVAIPDIISKLFSSCSAAQDEMKKIKEVIAEDIKKRRSLEIEVEEEKNRLSKIKCRLPDVKNNKEYSALLSEIEAINQKIIKIEDRQLELMEIIEEKSRGIPEKEEDIKNEERKFLELKGEKEAELEKAKKRLEEMELKRSNIIENIDNTLIQRYNTILAVKDVVVVKLTDGICQGCNTELPPQFAIEVKRSNEIYNCPYCDRIFYVEAEKIDSLI